MKPVLAAVDLSRESPAVARRAAILAGAIGTRVELLHVLDRASLNSLRDLLRPHAGAAARIVEDARRRMRELARAAAEPAGVEVSVRVEVGDPLGAILAAARRCELLALGPRGANPLRELFLGTTAMRVLSRAPRPTLVVRRHATERYRRALVAVDLAPGSLEVVHAAARLAPGAALTVFHAYEVAFEGRLRGVGIPEEEILRYRQQARQEALEALEALLEDLPAQAGPARSAAGHGAAARLIANREGRLGADLVVVGLRRRPALESLVLGSTTRGVLAESGCDVLVVPESESLSRSGS